MRASIRPTTHVTSGSTQGERPRIESAHEAARPRCPRAHRLQFGAAGRGRARRCLRAGAPYGRRLVGAGERAAVLGRNAHGSQASGSRREAAGCDGDLAGIADRAAAVRRRRADPPLGRVRATLRRRRRRPCAGSDPIHLALSVDAHPARLNLQWRSTRVALHRHAIAIPRFDFIASGRVLRRAARVLGRGADPDGCAGGGRRGLLGGSAGAVTPRRAQRAFRGKFGATARPDHHGDASRTAPERRARARRASGRAGRWHPASRPAAGRAPGPPADRSAESVIWR